MKERAKTKKHTLFFYRFIHRGLTWLGPGMVEKIGARDGFAMLITGTVIPLLPNHAKTKVEDLSHPNKGGQLPFPCS